MSLKHAIDIPILLQLQKKGYEQIEYFTETAENEKEHAKVFLNLEGGLVEITVSILQDYRNNFGQP